MLLTPRSSRCTLASIALATVLALPLALFAQASESSPAAPPPVVASRLTQPIDDSSRVTLGGNVHPLARAANDRGAAPDGMQLDRLQIVLKRSNTQESALRQLITAMHTPGSASYHQWLTPDQFGQQFGPADADVATLETWLQSHGFGSFKLNAGRQTLEFSGSAAQFRSTFHAEIHRYQVNGETHYANATDPQIPAALAAVVGGFSSLNNFRIKPNSKTLGKAAYDPASHQATPQWTTTAAGSSIPNLVLAPADFAVQYDVNPLYAAKITGTGETIAIVNDSNINPALVASFRTLFGLPASTPNVIIDGNDPGIDGVNNPDGPNGDSTEAYLDVEWSGAVAPNANIDLVIAADTALESGLVLAAEHVVFGNLAPILSLSFGNCESQLGASGNAFWNSLWEQAAAQGITVLVSSGDSGSAGCDNPDTQQYAVLGQQVSGIASTPFDVAVGGTDFFYSSYNSGSTATITSQLGTYWTLTPTNNTPTASILGYVPEQPWNDSQYGLDIFTVPSGTSTIAAGSGGASNAAVPLGVAGTNFGPYPKPSWQTGTGVPNDSARDLPDLALFAADGANASFTPICANDGDCQPVASGATVQITGVGGTSVAAPSFAGIMALINQKYGAPQGQADFVLYPLAAQFPTAFHDVTTGTNSVPCNVTVTSITANPAVDCIPVTNPLTIADPTFGTAVEGQIGVVSSKTPEYNAGVGYDLATGLGSIDANVLVSNWGNVKFAPSTVTLTPSSTSFTHGTAITISGAVAPTGSTTPTGSVALMTDSTTPLQAGQTTFPLTNGAFSDASVNFLPGGTYNIWGQYSGDGTNAASTSAKTSITVAPEASTLIFNLLNTASTSTGTSAIGTAPIPYGTQVLLSGEPVSTSFYNTCIKPPTPPASCNTEFVTSATGSVTFTDNGTTLKSAPLNVEGDAEFNAPFSVGTHSVAASYPGDPSYTASTAAAVAFTVAKDTPIIGFSSTSQTAATIFQANGPITFTVQVENNANGANESANQVAFYSPVAAPTGTVTITGLPSGVPTSVTLQPALDPNSVFPQGVGLLTATATLAPGNYPITISYSGDANYNPNTATETISIAAANGALSPSTTAAASSATATSPSAAISVTTTVTGVTGKPAPTGTVLFASSGTAIASVALSPGTGDVSTGVATLNSSVLLLGSNQITVQYSGDTVYQPSSTTLTLANGAGPSITGFALSGTAVNLSAGGSATSTITTTGGPTFSGNVTFTCAVTSSPASATNPPTCAAASVAVTAGATVTTPLTINSTAPTTAKLENPLNRLFAIGGGATLASLLFFGLPLGRRRWRSLLSLLVFAVIAGAAIGCGGGSSAPTPTATGGTTAGTYTVVVTGTSSGSATAIANTTAIAVTIN